MASFTLSPSLLCCPRETNWQASQDKLSPVDAPLGEGCRDPEGFPPEFSREEQKDLASSPRPSPFLLALLRALSAWPC